MISRVIYCAKCGRSLEGVWGTALIPVDATGDPTCAPCIQIEGRKVAAASSVVFQLVDSPMDATYFPPERRS